MVGWYHQLGNLPNSRLDVKSNAPLSLGMFPQNSRRSSILYWEDNPIMTDSHRFGYWVQSLRKAKGKTQREVAAAAGIDFTYLSKLEHGNNPAPSEDLIMRLAGILDVSDDYLLAAAGKVPLQVRQRMDRDPRFALLLRRLADADDATLDKHYRLAQVAKVPIPETGVSARRLPPRSRR
jgi:transcriptional regulator with XRE-family HTH domain